MERRSLHFALRAPVGTTKIRSPRTAVPPTSRLPAACFQQARDRHRPDAARHRRDGAGAPRALRRTRRRRPAASCRPAAGTRLMPTSITIAPGLIQSPRTISAGRRPPPGCRRGGTTRRQIARARMGDRHRAVSRSSSCATGLPTMFERPITTALEPRQVAQAVLQQHQAAERRAGHQRRGAPSAPAGRH